LRTILVVLRKDGRGKEFSIELRRDLESTDDRRLRDTELKSRRAEYSSEKTHVLRSMDRAQKARYRAEGKKKREEGRWELRNRRKLRPTLE